MEAGWLPLQEAARKYEVKPRTLHRWCALRKVRARKVAGFWEVNDAALAAFLVPVEVANG